MQEATQEKVSGPGLSSAVVQEETYFTVCSMPGTLSIEMFGPSGQLTPDIQFVNLSEYAHKVVYTPTEHGAHIINVRTNDVHVVGSPFSVLVSAPETSGSKADSSSAPDEDNDIAPENDYVAGPGLTNATLDEPANFTIHSPSGRWYHVKISADGYYSGGSCHHTHSLVVYKPTVPGTYTISVHMDGGRQIRRSPWTVVVSAKDQVNDKKLDCTEDPGLEDTIYEKAVHGIIASGPGLTSANVNGTTEVKLSPLEYHIPQVCEAILMSPSGTTTRLSVSRLLGGTRFIHYTPTMPGVHTLSITFRGVHVRGSPFNVSVNDEGIDYAEGPGLVSAEVDVETFFDIKTKKPGRFIVTFSSGLTYNTYTLQENLHFTYSPKSYGKYTVSIMRDGCSHVRGSPFSVEIRSAKKTMVESVPISIPVAHIQAVLLSYTDMPIEMFRPLAQRLLEKDKMVDIALVSNNIGNSRDSLARLEVLLKGGVKLFKKDGNRFRDCDVFDSRESGSVKQLLSEYLMSLSGEDLEDARAAFKTFPHKIPVMDTSLFVHLQTVPLSITNPDVLFDCARAGVYQSTTGDILKSCMAEISKTTAQLTTDLALERAVTQNLRQEESARLSQISDLQHSVNQKKEHCEKLSDMISESDRQMGVVRCSLQNITTERDALLRDVRALEGWVKKQDDVITDLHARIATMTDERNKREVFFSDLFKTTDADLSVLRKKLDALTREYDNLVERHKDAISARNAAVSERDALVQKLDTVALGIKDALKIDPSMTPYDTRPLYE